MSDHQWFKVSIQVTDFPKERKNAIVAQMLRSIADEVERQDYTSKTLTDAVGGWNFVFVKP